MGRSFVRLLTSLLTKQAKLPSPIGHCDRQDMKIVQRQCENAAFMAVGASIA